jgi:hypothetical protein
MPDDIELLKREIKLLKVENDILRLQLDNAMLLYTSEMTASGKLPKIERAPVVAGSIR